MNLHYDLAKADIATRLHQAQNRRTARLARPRHRPAATPRWRLLNS